MAAPEGKLQILNSRSHWIACYVAQSFEIRFHCSNHSAVRAARLSSSACCVCRKDKLAEPGNLPKSSARSEIGTAFCYFVLKGSDCVM